MRPRALTTAIAAAESCSMVARIDPGSSRTAAARSNAPPATARKDRPPKERGPSPIASAMAVTPTRQMPSITKEAAGKPATAMRLIVRVIGSYPGVENPAATIRHTATGVATRPTAPKKTPGLDRELKHHL